MTYEFVIENAGNVTLHNLTLTEDFATQFGGAFVSVIAPPTIVAGAGAVAPTGDITYDGATSSDVFDGISGEIEAGETITVQITVEIDPDAATAVYNADGELENSATASGTDPNDPTGTPVEDTRLTIQQTQRTTTRTRTAIQMTQRHFSCLRSTLRNASPDSIRPLAVLLAMST